MSYIVFGKFFECEMSPFRLMAIIYFKNCLHRSLYAQLDDSEQKSIREILIRIMMHEQDNSICNNLAVLVSLIVESDYPQSW